MDRRRRTTSVHPSKRALPRFLRRPLALLRRALTSTEFLYFGISIILLAFMGAVIVLLDERSTASSAFPLDAERLLSDDKSSNQSALHATGSIRELDQLLQRITNESAANGVRRSRHDGVIVAVAVNYSFRDLALNFVCNLKRLGISNYVVLAMDRTVYDYLSARKTNAFFHAPTTRRRLLMDDGDNFGSSSFVETSRRKSLLVLKVLRLGYSVVFSDVDVVWIRNPIPSLLSYDFDFVLQSDRSYQDQDAAPNYNLNSGFYLARSSVRAITALQAIVKYAVAIRRSEQKAFNYVLCGAFKDHRAGPGLRVGSSSCTYKHSGATAFVLPLEAFPNGSDMTLWNESSTPFERVYPKIVAVHANYVTGRAAKVERIQKIGFWMHSEESKRLDQCLFTAAPGG